MDVKQKLPLSNKDQTVSNTSPAAIKPDKSETALLHNGLSSLVAKHTNSLESVQSVQARNQTEGQEESIAFQNNNKTSISINDEFPTGSARLKISPLKGLSSTLKPRMLKSIGIQVGPDRW